MSENEKLKQRCQGIIDLSAYSRGTRPGLVINDAQAALVDCLAEIERLGARVIELEAQIEEEVPQQALRQLKEERDKLKAELVLSNRIEELERKMKKERDAETSKLKAELAEARDDVERLRECLETTRREMM
jgi:predicted RNase H-like nuclease (RuvC/YqgF family)